MHKNWYKKSLELECGPMPNVMAALPNVDASSVQRRKVWLTPTNRVPCSNAANPLKLAGVPQTPEPISAVSRPKFTIVPGHVEEVLLFKKFFPIVDRCLSCEDIARQICAMVPRWRIFGDTKAISLVPNVIP